MEVRGHINDSCGGWSESSIELNTYMYRVKQLLCPGVVMVQD